MAVALATLGQKEGFALQSTCKTNEGLAMLRLSAAGDLMQLHDDSCLSDLLDFIREQQAAHARLSFATTFSSLRSHTSPPTNFSTHPVGN